MIISLKISLFSPKLQLKNCWVGIQQQSLTHLIKIQSLTLLFIDHWYHQPSNLLAFYTFFEINSSFKTKNKLGWKYFSTYFTFCCVGQKSIKDYFVSSKNLVNMQNMRKLWVLGRKMFWLLTNDRTCFSCDWLTEHAFLVID